MPRLVRRKPLSERIMSALNPMDFLLWLSEELETRDWDSTSAGTQLGLAMNFIFLIARANSGSYSSSDDVFTDEAGSGWLAFFVYPLVWILGFFSLTNAFYTIARTRKYRLFQANVEEKLSTPSARRVKVDQSNSSPSTPLRYLASIIAPDSADSRAHPDKGSDVWELSVWDPLPVSLRLFCLFGPGHVLVYMIFLPLAPLDPRPSVSVFNTLLLQVIISGQLLFFCSRFTQQAKDTAIIQKQVMKEYDTKFVHPRLQPVVRDVGTQLSEDQPHEWRDFVQTGTPTTQIRHSFQTHTNPYTRPVDAPEEQSITPIANSAMKPQMFTPPTASRRSEFFKPTTGQRSSVPRHSLPAGYTSTGTSSALPNMNFGGSMGIHTHSNSPLKKATSLNELNSQETASPRNSREMAAYEQRNWGQKTPSRHTDSRRLTGSNLGSAGNPFAGLAVRHSRISSEGQLRGPYSGEVLPAPQKRAQSLSLGDVGEWVKARREPAQSTTLGDVGVWFKSKLPSNRPERGGTLRKRGYWEKKEKREKQSPHGTLTELDQSMQRLPQPHLQNWRGITERHYPSRRSDTGGSDRIMSWNTPKNLSDTQPDPVSLTIPKIRTDRLPSKGGRKWSWTPLDSLDSLRIGKLRNKGLRGVSATKKETTASEVDGIWTQSSTQVSRLRKLLADKKKARQERRSLKESGDYLGVQGHNPQTGVPDIVSNSDSAESTLDADVERRLNGLKKILTNAQSAAARDQAENEILKIRAQQETERLQHRKLANQKPTASVRWRRKTHQWSSAQEPELSPIAQSQRSGSLFSRRHSRVNGAMAGQGRLIDLSPPEDEQSFGQASDTSWPHEPTSAHIGSSDTVVQTPNRQSLADSSPTALELFENGIRFDHPDEPRQNGGPLLTRPQDATRDTSGLLQETKHLQAAKAAIPCAASPTKKQDEKQIVESFLGEGPQGEIEPGGSRTRWATTSSKSLPKLSMILRPLPVNHSFKFIQMNGKIEGPTYRKKHMAENLEHDSTTNHQKSIILQTSKEPTIRNPSTERQFNSSTKSPDRRNSLSRSAKGSHALSPVARGPDWKTETTARGKINHLAYDRPTKILGRGPLNTCQAPEVEAEVASDLKGWIMTTKEVQAAVKTIRRQLARVDQPNLTTIKKRGNNDVNQIWAQETIRDLINKRNEVKKACASTLTITTTGCVQTGSGSHRKTIRDSHTGPQQRRKLNRVIYNLRDPGAAPDSLRNFQENRGPSTSPKSVSETEIQAIDTTLASLREPMEQQLKVAVSAKTLELETEASVAQQECSSSSTSTSTMGLDDWEKEAGGRTLWRSHMGQSLECPPLRHLMQISNPTVDQGVHVPGSFPTHLDAEDGIAGLSSKRYTESETRGFWDAAKEVLHTLDECGTWLLSRYWAMVQPVFNPRSEYWKRADGEKNDWGDMASLCLALPLMIGTLIGLVWVMELIAMAMRCKNGGLDCVADEALEMVRRT
ncbi:hypothetical protein NM208_g13296 [Fusarium decemcellulare]|uniref:Uncharacterized protein n=1 Tax=Fusarium decemcellulare TaxID=57161 RepID=A0ACC1RKB1_9HYPO|nr:hypothetical protein NM208_g13296 [Fusarium decemcellulare]